MSLILPAVARRFLYACRKCSVDRFHIVLAHLGPDSAKVQCEVCGSKKTFRLAQLKANVEGSERKGGARSTRGSYGVQYQSLQDKLGSQPASSYLTSGRFETDQVIDHPKFGIGFVVEARQDRIQVAFSDELKTLLHNRA